MNLLFYFSTHITTLYHILTTASHIICLTKKTRHCGYRHYHTSGSGQCHHLNSSCASSARSRSLGHGMPAKYSPR